MNTTASASPTTSPTSLHRATRLLALVAAVTSAGGCGVVVPDLQQCLVAYAECGLIEYVPVGPGMGTCACVDDEPLEPVCWDDADCGPGAVCVVADHLYYNELPTMEVDASYMIATEEPEPVATCQPREPEPHGPGCAPDEVMYCDDYGIEYVGDGDGIPPPASCWCEPAYFEEGTVEPNQEY